VVDLGISVVAVAELMHGAYRAQDEARKQRRLKFIERLCADIPIYPVTLEVARMVGRMEGELAGRGISVALRIWPLARPLSRLVSKWQRQTYAISN